MSRFSLESLFTSKNYPYLLQRVLAPIVLVVLVISLVVFGVSAYVVNQEKKLGAELHTLIEDFEGIEFEEETLAYEEELDRLSRGFVALYETAKRSHNGKRALYHAGLTEYAAEDFSAAEQAFTTLFEQDKKFYLAPQALYFRALALEELERYQEAVVVLDDYEKLYKQTSFLNLEVVLAKARNYAWLGDYAQAEELCRSIIKDTDDLPSFSASEVGGESRAESNEQTYSDKAQELLDFLKIVSNVNPSS